ncbi:MAG: hypothetical protein WBF71_03795 [Microthrixaceae bacterium]
MPRTGLVIPIFLSVTLMAFATGCGGGEKAKDAGATTTSSSAAGHEGHSGDQQYGGVHAPPVVNVDEVAKFGDGPDVGDTWTASIAVNVCGRFLDPLPGVATNGLTPQPNGTIQLSPRTKAESGLSLTLADYSMAVGLDLKTGELSLPDTVTPSEIPVRDTNVPLAGKTFKDGADCGGTKANVVVWVYSAEAVETGEGLVTVVEDPQDIPFPTDGMAMVITLSPESSLPTLPPSVVQAG